MTTIHLPPEPLVTAQAVAIKLDVHRNTVLNMAKDGRIRTAGRMPGPRGAWLFTEAEVERLRALLKAAA